MRDLTIGVVMMLSMISVAADLPPSLVERFALSYGGPAQPSAKPVRSARSDRIRMPPGLAQLMIRRAVNGARERLMEPGCQQILDIFVDDAGSRLRDRLRALNRTPAQYLGELWFVDGTGIGPCEGSYAAAFTSPGRRVVYICAARFGNSINALCGTAGEVIVIHEMLHTLGLNENPPSSEAITRQVWRKCA